MRSTTSTPKEEVPAPSDPKMDRRMRRARLVRDGLSWRAACLHAGYSLSVANKGARGYAQGSRNENRSRSVLRPGIAKDFERAAAEATYKPEFMKAAATHRLMTAILEGRSSDVAREIEVLGKFKEHDWFVNPTSGTTMGVFLTLGDPEGGKMLDEAIAEMKNFRDGSEFYCAWCNQEHACAEALQTHSLCCAKRPVTIHATHIDQLEKISPRSTDLQRT
jgi:hypothetical protein